MPLSSFIDTFSGSRKARRGNDLFAFEALRSEFDELFLNTILSGSLVTAKALLRPVQGHVDVKCYLPKAPAVSLPAALALVDLPIPRDAIRAVANFHKSIESARETTVSLLARRETARSDHPAWLAASLQWRKCAADALIVIDALRPLIESFDAEASGALERTCDLMRRVRDGETPCIDEFDRVYFPKIDERRSNMRRTVTLPAWHQVGEARAPVTLENISTTGIGVDGCAGVRTGDRIAIEVPSGRVLLAFVVWVNGRRLGARLIEPLTAGDVLLSA